MYTHILACGGTMSVIACPTNPPTTVAADTPNPPAPKRGRPVVFNDQKRNHFCSLLRLGCTISQAAASVGMSRRGILYAAKRDPSLAERIRLARQESRLELINKIAR